MKIDLQLTAKQERHLMQVGLAVLTQQLIGATTSSNGTSRGPYTKGAHPNTGKQWTDVQRENFALAIAARRAKRAAEGRPVKPRRMRTAALLPPPGARPVRHDGRPFKQPGKAWTPEHRANFIRGYKKAMARKKRLAKQLDREVGKVKRDLKTSSSSKAAEA